MATLLCGSTGKSCHQHYDLISCSVTLSWNCTNQSLPYPNYAERLVRKCQVSILKSLLWLCRDSNRQSSDFLFSQNGKRTLYSFGDPRLVSLLGRRICASHCTTSRALIQCTYIMAAYWLFSSSVVHWWSSSCFNAWVRVTMVTNSDMVGGE